MTPSSTFKGTPENITDFDFRRTDQLPQADIQEFQSTLKKFGDGFETELGTYLRAEFSIVLQEVRESTWGAYAMRLGAPCCLMMLRPQVASGWGALELGRSFVFTVLDLLLGGKTDPVPERELTAIEKRLLAAFFDSARRRLRDAWTVDGPDFVLESVLGSSSAASEIPEDDPIVLAEFVVHAGEARGHFCLAVPARFVRRRRQDPDTLSLAATNLRRPEESEAILARLRSGTVQAQTLLTKASIRMGDLAALQPGDILDLGYAISSPLALCVNGAAVYSGYVVSAGDKRAFSIQSVEQRAENIQPGS